MRSLKGLVLLLAVSSLTLAGCSDKTTTPAAPTAINVTGTWAGPVTAAGATARMTWTLTQTDVTVNGPVTLSLPTGTVLLNGFLTGTINGSTLTYTISVGPGGIPTQPSCAGQLGGTMAVTIGTTSTLVGAPAITSSTCAPPFTPGQQVTLTKQ